VQANVHRLCQIDRDLQVGDQQIGRARRQHRHRYPHACHRVEAALYRAVAAPEKQQVGAVVDRLAGERRGFAALGDLVPNRVREALVGQKPT
jgi:hypothetical protein